MFRRMLFVLLIILLLLPNAALANRFPDDIGGHWARPQVEQLVAFGIISGYPDNTFRPEENISRAAFLKLMVTARGLPRSPGSAGFSDTEGHWVATQGYLGPAIQVGIINSSDYPGQRFEPDKPITRQEMAAMIVKALGLAPEENTLSFTDREKIGRGMQGFVAVAVSKDIIRGFPDNSFGPDLPATRAQAAVMVMRMLNVLGPPKDVAGYVRVTRVIDGDTFEIAGGEHVRLIGVNTPEIHHPTKGIEPYGKEAAAFTKKLLEGKYVRLEKDVQERDRYGRLLAYVYLVDGTFVNAELLRQGYAQVMTVPPNVRHQEEFLRLQAEAREQKRGLWADTVTPEESSPQGLTVRIASVDLKGEVVVISNDGAADVDISGWKLVSEVGNQSFVFPPGTTLPAGGTLKIVSGPSAQPAPGVLVWTKNYIWNNDGDPALLYDSSGRLISRID